MDDLEVRAPATGPAADDRIARLSAAILKVSQSLEVKTVLREAIAGARSLTGAGSGAVAMVCERGRIRNLITSGVSRAERREIVEWPDGARLFERLRKRPGPLRVPDLPGYLKSRGFTAAPWASGSLEAAPMHHRDRYLGHFFLGDKETGKPFAAGDEEILALFASQAATAIANARAHREVERARADLEALVETSPVGVVVLDAATGRAVSLNREARRIVEAIRTPGFPAEQLLEVMRCRFADGRESSLEELPMARQLEDARTTHAEEIELSVPDGRSLRTLVNATPIRSDTGRVISVVVTMQDLAPLEELERQRTGFLQMLSHELRAPLIAIKGSTTTALHAAPPPDRAETRQIFRIIDGQADRMRRLIANLLDAGSIEAGTLTVAPEASGVAALVDEARSTFLTGGGRHPVLVDLPPDLPRVMADPERIVQVLGNLISNAARNSPPAAPVRIAGAREGGFVALAVSDEGSGFSPEQIPHLFRKRAGLTRDTGLGLAISKGLVEAHGGRIRAESGGPGLGARFTFTIPVAPAPEEQAVSPGGPVRPPGPARARTRILVVDDDPEMLRYVRSVLNDAGYAPVVTGNPEGLARIIRSERPSLVLLDLLLPGTDGIELMRKVPGLGDIPVIFISAYGRDETIARALERGAADYIVKPFSPTELLARVQAALRHRGEPETFALGDLAIDYGPRRVRLAGREASLTATEFDLLRVLSLNAGNVVTTEVLLRRVWGQRGAGNAGRVRSVVKRIRRKIGDDAGQPVYIFNEHGVGYRMADPGEGQAPTSVSGRAR